MKLRFVDTDDGRIKSFTDVKKIEVIQDTVYVTHKPETYEPAYTFTCKLNDIISIEDDNGYYD